MKIAFVNTDMNVGGIPKASIPLLKELVKEHEITLFLTHGGGDIIGQVPHEVKIQIFPSLGYKGLLVEALKQGRVYAAIKCLFKYKRARNWIEGLRAWVNIRRKVEGHYDLAIAYFGMNAKCVLVTLDQISATKKVAFMHGDHPFKPSELPIMGSLYMQFDKLYSVSDATRQKFIRDYPRCEGKADVFYNIMDVEYIRAKSEDRLPTESFKDKSKLHIVTVGRISPEKGQMMIPTIAQKLNQDGMAFIWHIIGAGSDYERLQKEIVRCGLSENIILHGNADNPYPYIKQADIYVQPSYTEGYCLTILEAAILGRPIVATKVGGTWEHFKDGHNILLCEAEPQSIYQKISQFAKIKDMRDHFSCNVINNDWSNITEISKLITL